MKKFKETLGIDPMYMPRSERGLDRLVSEVKEIIMAGETIERELLDKMVKSEFALFKRDDRFYNRRRALVTKLWKKKWCRVQKDGLGYRVLPVEAETEPEPEPEPPREPPLEEWSEPHPAEEPESEPEEPELEPEPEKHVFTKVAPGEFVIIHRADDHVTVLANNDGYVRKLRYDFD
jgi:hypothetical protein